MVEFVYYFTVWCICLFNYFDGSFALSACILGIRMDLGSSSAVLLRGAYALKNLMYPLITRKKQNFRSKHLLSDI